MAIAALVSPTTAQDASVAPQDFADYFTRWKMALALETEENAPIGSQYDVIPLTMEAGLQQTDLSKVSVCVIDPGVSCCHWMGCLFVVRPEPGRS